MVPKSVMLLLLDYFQMLDKGSWDKGSRVEVVLDVPRKKCIDYEALVALFQMIS